ncbi:hypothetical protein DKT69_13065 [Micromonospora sicca]|uniref:DUF11 domain-containing protein n=1 Tax=Micromonospora sicca TaxID=2202420 RepID=A0A317DQ10_9ACTN|nr:hypothetical protein DKT69_13065 [Micromonospora sp. 4G51]
MRVTRAFRVGTAALAAATMVAAVESPAAAETDPGWVSGWLDDTTIGAAGAPGRTAGLVLSSTGATNPRVTFDLSGLTGVATATFPDWCVTDAAAVTCPMPPTATPDEFGALNGTLPVVLRAVTGAADGATGTIGYTALADGVDGWAQQATVTVHAGPDVIDLVDEYVSGAATGDQLAMPVSVLSAGDQPADDLQITLRFPVGVEPAAYRNCRYGAGDQLSTIVVCTVGGELTPGARYEIPGGFATSVGPAAVGDKRISQTVAPADTAGPLPAGVTFTRRDADQSLRLRQVGQPVDVIGPEHQYPSGQYYLRAIRGAFDVVALGATATGSAGDTVRVEVGLRNDGPGVPDGTISGNNAAWFVFTPPAGTAVSNRPANCSPAGSEEEEPDPTVPVTWYCTKPGGIFAAGETYLVGFDLRIDGPLGTTGEVRIPHGYPRADDDPANDTAAVTVS